MSRMMGAERARARSAGLASLRLGALLVLAAVLAGCTDSSPTPPPPPDLPPPAPSGLTVRSGAFVDTLTWSPVDAVDFQAYEVWRGRRGSFAGSPDTTWVRLGRNASALDTVWIDPYVSPGHRYAYRVWALDLAGQRSDDARIEATTTLPDGPALGFEPRRASVQAGTEVELTLWIVGAADLHGLVLDIVHSAPRSECSVGQPLGDPTLSVCMGEIPEPTQLALSAVRGAPGLTGSAELATVRFGPVPAVPDSVFLRVHALEREDGTAIPGAESAELLPASWEIAIDPEEAESR